jgi:hypothetical protein
VGTTSHLPDFDRLSVLTATLWIAYTIARFIEIPPVELATQLPGLYLELAISVNTIVALLVAVLTASGCHWLLQTHPGRRQRGSLEPLLLPALSALVLSLLLGSLPGGAAWVIALVVGGLILVGVLIAEYLVVDEQDPRQPLAALALTAVSFGLLLILAISLRALNVRLYLLLPALAPAAGLVSLRALSLRAGREWRVADALTVALIIGHLAAALHYWPLSPVTYGLALLGPAYALTSLLGNLATGQRLPSAAYEPGLAFTVLSGLAVWAA